MTFCGGERSVKRSLDDPAPPHTKHTKTAVPQITESSQVEGRGVVGRRVRDLVRLDGLDDLRVAQGPALVLVDQLEALARGVLELGPAREATRETFAHLRAIEQGTPPQT